MPDPYIKEAATLMEQAKDALASGADKVREVAGNPDVTKLLPYLLAGGAGAVGGSMLSGKRKQREGETRGQYLTRVLRNAVVAGGLTAGGTYLAGKGLEKTVGSFDMENPMTGKEGDQGPAASLARDVASSYLGAGTAGAATLALTRNRPLLGANPHAAGAGENLLSSLKGKYEEINNAQKHLKKDDPNRVMIPSEASDLKALKALAKSNPAKLADILSAAPDAAATWAPSVMENAKKYGINTHNPSAVGIGGSPLNAHRLHNLGEPLSAVFGRSKLRRTGRGVLGLAGALVPASISALTNLTPESE